MPAFDDIEHAAVTDVGIRRSHNQDALAVQRAGDEGHWRTVGHVFLVADGMGGHAVGEKASAKAVQEIPLTFTKHAADGPAGALKRAFQETNSGIHAIGQATPEFRGMGTTATALVIRREGAWIGHVGDSRCYRVRDGKLDQLSYDHSYAWEMARRLGISPDELTDVKKNVIVRSLGPDGSVQVDVEGPHPLTAGDTFVLCSDGLSNLVPPEELGAIITAMPLEEAAKFLVDLANLRGGPDNITVILVKVGASEASTKATQFGEGRGLFGRLWAGWSTRFPWHISVLMAGFLVTLLFILARVAQIPGNPVLFVVAAGLIGVGIVGLFLHAKNPPPEPTEDESRDRELHVYRTYSCRLDPVRLGMLMELETHLREHLETHPPINVDWAKHKKHLAAAKNAGKEGDLLIAFREICRAIHTMASVYNKLRNKDAGFKPKWESSEV